MRKSITAPEIRARKVTSPTAAVAPEADPAPPLVMVTAYDAPTARVADDAGVDMILVGDSVAMVVLGYDDTLSVSVDDMAHHVAAVHRGIASNGADREDPAPLVIGE